MTQPDDNFIPDFGAADEQQPSTLPPESTPSPHEEVDSDGVRIRIYFPPGAAPDPNKTRPQTSLSADEPSPTNSVHREDPTPLPSGTRTFEPVPVLAEPPPLIRESEYAQPAKASRRGGCSRALFAVIALAFICLLVGGSLGAWAYFTNSIPPNVVSAVETSAYEQGVNVSIYGTDTATPAATSTSESVTYVPTVRPSATSTSGIAVTVLPSPSTSPTRTVESEPAGEGIVQNDTPMVYVPGGTFSMGSDEAANERPIHEVTLDPYYIDQYEVTNASYASCVEDGGCESPGSTTAYDSTPYYGVDEYRKYPVVYVSWYSSSQYCEWRGARLPTEAEWEMAARWDPATETAMVYPWGEEWDPTRLNYCDASCLINDPLLVDETFDDSYPQMAPVGSFPEGISPVGAHDMAGNVAEWAYDWYSANYYIVSPKDNPTGPESGSSRVVRGGGWSLDWFRNRTTARLPWGPQSEVAGIGFRCAISADAVNP